MDVSFRDWAWLPPLLVNTMVAKLDPFSAFVRFCGVFPQWRYIALESNVDHKVNFDVLKSSRGKLPMLMFKTDGNNEECRSLYSVSDGKTYTVKLPLPYKKRFAGSSFGWLFCVEEDTIITLVNPYKNCPISLPAIVDPCDLHFWEDFSLDYYIEKAILSSDRHVTEKSFEVVAIFGGSGEVAFFRAGMPAWSFIDFPAFLKDIIYYKGKIYGISGSREFFQIDLDNRILKTIVPEHCGYHNQSYLVELQDELLMITRTWNGDPFEDSIVNSQDRSHSNNENACSDSESEFRVPEPNTEDYIVNSQDRSHSNNENVFMDSESEFRAETNTEDYIFNSQDRSHSNNENVCSDSESEIRVPEPNTYEFKVFKMTHPIEKGSAAWVEINNIGQHALFLGENHSVSVSTTKFPGCQPNSIYYTSQHHVSAPPYNYDEREEDSGIFNLEDGRFSKHHVLGSSCKYVQPSIWFLPNPPKMD